MVRDLKRDRCKTRILYTMGGKCCLCGYNKTFSAMDLHHIKPSAKSVTIGHQNFYNQSWETVCSELKKCALLCANCHREVHRDLTQYNLISTYSEDNALEVLQEIQEMKSNQKRFCKKCNEVVSKKEVACPKCGTIVFIIKEKERKTKIKEERKKAHSSSEQNNCKNCGKGIAKTTVYCMDCYKTIKRSNSLPPRNELKSILKCGNFVEIGNYYGVSDNAVRKWCKNYRLPYSSKIIRNTSHEGWEKEEWDDIPPKEASAKGIKRVVQITAENVPIRVFNSAQEAGRYIGKSGNHIGDVCNGKRKTAYGFHWRFEMV